MTKHTIKELVKISKENPGKIMKVEDGRVMLDGEVFKNEQELERVMKTFTKLIRFIDRFYKWCGIKKK